MSTFEELARSNVNVFAGNGRHTRFDIAAWQRKQTPNTAQENHKASMPDVYILNPRTGRYVKRDSLVGKNLMMVFNYA
jgi:hypothetical protein